MNKNLTTESSRTICIVHAPKVSFYNFLNKLVLYFLYLGSQTNQVCTFQ